VSTTWIFNETYNLPLSGRGKVSKCCVEAIFFNHSRTDEIGKFKSLMCRSVIVHDFDHPFIFPFSREDDKSVNAFGVNVVGLPGDERCFSAHEVVLLSIEGSKAE
jgi:hypothetical protein